MSAPNDAVNFDIIEAQKENIQALPSGRSARTLANLFSASPLQPLATPTPSDTTNLNDAQRAEFEQELLLIDETDDPLDIYDRYVRWTMDAYPSAQATPASQLLPLLERATKTFLSSSQYTNDSRYLKLWLLYIRLFSDTPREIFAFLSRHAIGQELALFYEEFAAWLEGAGRWAQAEEIYRLGLERDARPVARLTRKYNEFQQRLAAQPEASRRPTSPALPPVRAALGVKVDPFSMAAPGEPRQGRGVETERTAKSGKKKMAIFSDADAPEPAVAGSSAAGWDSIGSLADRKKENTIAPTPWAGQTLQAGVKKSSAPKMQIFKDQSIPISQPHVSRRTLNENSIIAEKEQVIINAKGIRERIYVNLEAMYPTPYIDGSERCSEELMALQRGYLDVRWTPEVKQAKPSKEKSGFEIFTGDDEPVRQPMTQSVPAKSKKGGFAIFSGEEVAQPEQEPERSLTRAFEETMTIRVDENGNAVKKKKHRKIKRMEVNETQTIKTNLASPSKKKKVRRRSGITGEVTGEQTMTFHTKAATDDIYALFNQPVQKVQSESEAEGSESESEEDEETDGDYTTDGESTDTGRMGGMSEAGDDTTRFDSDYDGDTTMGGRSEAPDDDARSEWSDFTASKHIPGHGDAMDEDEHMSDSEPHHDQTAERSITPVSPPQQMEVKRTTYVPVPPDDYVPPQNPYRIAAQISQNRLPFMTPIVEKTESSLGMLTGWANKENVNSKTPSKENGQRIPVFRDQGKLDSSPFQEIVNNSRPPSEKIAQPALGLSTKNKVKPVAKNAPFAKDVPQSGPIIKDAQCNPVDDYTRAQIFAGLQTPVTSYEGFFDHSSESIGKAAELKKYSKAVAKMNKNANDKTLTNLAASPVLHFPGTERQYMIKRELGAGAFAPVYLVENVADEDMDMDPDMPQMGRGEFSHFNRRKLEALKMEDPPTAWEFYIMRQAKRRLGVSRAAESIISAYEFHLYKDECFLIEEYRDQGTLLDLVNIARADNTQAGGVMDEILAMFFAIELLRTVEALHKVGILHGDLKADNILVRLSQTSSDKQWTPRYRADGTSGWAEKGVALIDFGRGIDIKAFRFDVGFIADWKTGPTDCAEMRELRPWTYQIDYFGLAGILHSMLFGKYIDTVADNRATLPGTGAGGKKWRVKESLKRYWQQEIWAECFDLLLNPTMHVEGEEGAKMPVLRGLKSVRGKMEAWVEENSEKGVGLQSMLRKLEFAIQARHK